MEQCSTILFANGFIKLMVVSHYLLARATMVSFLESQKHKSKELTKMMVQVIDQAQTLQLHTSPSTGGTVGRIPMETHITTRI